MVILAFIYYLYYLLLIVKYCCEIVKRVHHLLIRAENIFVFVTQINFSSCHLQLKCCFCKTPRESAERARSASHSYSETCSQLGAAQYDLILLLPAT